MSDSDLNAALDNQISEVMGEAEEPKGQPDAETTDEEVTQPEPEEETESEDSEEEQPEETEETKGDEDEDEESEEEDSESGDSITVKLDGEEVSLKQIKEWRDREKNLQAGYTKKYQELAEDRKQVQSSLDESLRFLNFTKAQMDAPLAQFGQVNWAQLQQADPGKYQQLHAQYRQLLQGREQVDKAMKAAQDKAEEQRKAETSRLAREARTTLQDRYPDWSDDLYHKALKYAVDNGAPQEEVSQETRPWVISAIVDQMRAEEARNIQTKPKTNSVKRTIKQKAATKPRTPAQKRADQAKRDRVLASKGDRDAQARLNKSEVNAAVDDLF